MRDFKAEATEREAVAQQLHAAARVVAGDRAPGLLDALATACAPWEWLRRRRFASHWGLGGDPEASMASLLPESRLREARAALRETVGRLLGVPRLSDKKRKRRDKLVQRVLGTPRRPGHHHALIQVIALVGREVTGQDPGYTRNDYTNTVEGPWVRLIKVALEYYSGESTSESVIARELWALRCRKWTPRGITERRPREHPGPFPTRADSLRRAQHLLRGQSGVQESARKTLSRQSLTIRLPVGAKLSTWQPPTMASLRQPKPRVPRPTDPQAADAEAEHQAAEAEVAQQLARDPSDPATVSVEEIRRRVAAELARRQSRREGAEAWGVTVSEMTRAEQEQERREESLRAEYEARLEDELKRAWREVAELEAQLEGENDPSQ